MLDGRTSTSQPPVVTRSDQPTNDGSGQPRVAVARTACMRRPRHRRPGHSACRPRGAWRLTRQAPALPVQARSRNDGQRASSTKPVGWAKTPPGTAHGLRYAPQPPMDERAKLLCPDSSEAASSSGCRRAGDSDCHRPIHGSSTGRFRSLTIKATAAPQVNFPQRQPSSVSLCNYSNCRRSVF